MRDERIDIRAIRRRNDFNHAEIKIGNNVAQLRMNSVSHIEILIDVGTDDEARVRLRADPGGREQRRLVFRIGERDVVDAADVNIAAQKN